MKQADPLEMLSHLIPYVSVVQHSPGDLELKFSLAILKRPDLKDLKSLADSLPGIRDMKVNIFSRTLLISYDPEIIGYDFWETVLSADLRPEKKAATLDEMRQRLGKTQV